MSTDISQESSAAETEGDRVPQAPGSKVRLDSHVDTPETDPKDSAQDEWGSHNGNGNNDNDDDSDDGKEKHDGEEDEEEGAVESDKTDEATTDPAQTNTPDNSAASESAAAGDWQAIWSPQHNAYYFYNARTQETTWVNPIQPYPGSSTSASSSVGEPSSSSLYPPSASAAALYAAAEAVGIDPSLAHLDPALAMPGGAPSGAFAAKFNARTGAFTRLDGRDPSFLSEAERAKRMSSVYFDVNAWEEELEQRYDEEAINGKKRKRPTKKDLERFKEQKRLKKIAKTAWLRT